MDATRFRRPWANAFTHQASVLNFIFANPIKIIWAGYILDKQLPVSQCHVGTSRNRTQFEAYGTVRTPSEQTSCGSYKLHQSRTRPEKRLPFGWTKNASMAWIFDHKSGEENVGHVKMTSCDSPKPCSVLCHARFSMPALSGAKDVCGGGRAAWTVHAGLRISVRAPYIWRQINSPMRHGRGQ